MNNKFNEALIERMQRDDQSAPVIFDNKKIEVEHLDGSKYSITNSKIEPLKVYDLPCLILLAEHNSPQIFVEYDLKKVTLYPRKGKKQIYKLDLDPLKAKPKKATKQPIKSKNKARKK